MQYILLGIMLSFLAGCHSFSSQSSPTMQGNILTEADVTRLHRNMTRREVIAQLGAPILAPSFSVTNHLEYVYIIYDTNGNKTNKQLICTFQNNRLKNIHWQTSST